DQLTRINKWYCEQMAYLAKRLAETPEPGGEGSLLDNTLVVWTNELGKGNSHTLDNIPWVLVGNGLDFRMAPSLKYPKLPHNPLLLAVAHGAGHRLETFGNPNFCPGGPLRELPCPFPPSPGFAGEGRKTHMPRKPPPPAEPTVTFWGAARTVTGSM